MNPLYIYPHYFRFFPLVSHYRVLTRIACAIWQILISYLHSSVYVNPHLPVYTSPPSPGNHSLFSKSVIHSTYFSVQFSSVAQSSSTLSDTMNRSTPGLPVHHQLPEFTQTHVHRVGDAIQPSHPLSSPSPPAPSPSQH